MVAGVCGPTEQAVEETEIARRLGYDAVLLSMGGLSGWSEEDILKRTEEIAQRMPVIGFYLQPSVGGNIFSFEFWRAFAEIPNIVAIKMAPSTATRRLTSFVPSVIQAAETILRSIRGMTITSSTIC